MTFSVPAETRLRVTVSTWSVPTVALARYPVATLRERSWTAAENGRAAGTVTLTTVRELARLPARTGNEVGVGFRVRVPRVVALAAPGARPMSDAIRRPAAGAASQRRRRALPLGARVEAVLLVSKISIPGGNLSIQLRVLAKTPINQLVVDSRLPPKLRKV
jgi:hypothetical protein